jgi:hypothetical protein
MPRGLFFQGSDKLILAGFKMVLRKIWDRIE